MLGRNDEMVMQMHSQVHESRADARRKIPVGQRRPMRTGGMVMDQHHTVGTVAEHEFRQFTGFQRHMVTRTVTDLDIGKQSALFVQKRGPHFFVTAQAQAARGGGGDVGKSDSRLLLYGALRGTGNDFPDERAESVHAPRRCRARGRVRRPARKERR